MEFTSAAQEVGKWCVAVAPWVVIGGVVVKNIWDDNNDRRNTQNTAPFRNIKKVDLPKPQPK